MINEFNVIRIHSASPFHPKRPDGETFRCGICGGVCDDEDTDFLLLPTSDGKNIVHADCALTLGYVACGEEVDE